MAPKNEGTVGTLLANALNKGLEIFAKFRPGIDIAPLTLGAAMPPQIHGIDFVALGDEIFDHVTENATVPAQSVNQRDDTATGPIGMPALKIKITVSESPKSAFDMSHSGSLQA
jgi:hypothetical protein